MKSCILLSKYHFCVFFFFHENREEAEHQRLDGKTRAPPLRRRLFEAYLKQEPCVQLMRVTVKMEPYIYYLFI